MRTASTAPRPATEIVYVPRYVPRSVPPNAVRLKRLRSGVTMTDLSIESGLSTWLLSNVERGMRPLRSTEQRTINEALRRICARQS
jgi:hypothetical protein